MADGTVLVGKKKGFAAMDRELVREIARKGGVAAHVAGTAHEYNRETAMAAGKLGGRATAAKRLAEKQSTEKL